MRRFRHIGMSVAIADWTDEELADALSLVQGWHHPDAPSDVQDLRARAAELREKGYTAIPPCADADEKGVCPGHEEPDPWDRV